MEKVPLSAASKLNGRVEVDREEVKGGSMRVKGADTRRDLFVPTVFRLGERPAGAVMGARGDDIFARMGVVKRAGSGGGSIDLAGASEKLKGLTDFSNASALLFLEGELKMVGSIFSPSMKVEGSYGRLAGESACLSVVTLALDFDAITPTLVSTCA